MRNFIRKIKSIFEKSTTVNYDTEWNLFLDMMRDGRIESYKSYCFACINARAENVSKAKISLFTRDGEGGSMYELKEHPFLNLIAKPNKRGQTFSELLHKISTSLDLYGNAYLYVSRGIDKLPIGLYHLPSRAVEILLNKDNTEIEYYRYNVSGGTVSYRACDVVHFMIPNPDSNFSGKSTISGFNFTLEIDYLQNLYQRNFYKNDASIGMLLECEHSISDEKYERYVNQFRQMYEGAVNSGKTLLLDSGIKAKPYQAFPKDVEILPSRKLIRDEIMTIFRVPKIILGITDDVNRANSRESIKIFNDYVIKPFAKINIESKLNNFLRENYPDRNIFITMDYEFEIDRELQLRAYEIFRKYDIASVDEIREMEGL
ncbi:MAG: phage portal protein [Ignavibacteria bacterium]